MPTSKPRKIVRDTRTGKIVPAREATRRPSTTVTETVRRVTHKKK